MMMETNCIASIFVQKYSIHIVWHTECFFSFLYSYNGIRFTIKPFHDLLVCDCVRCDIRFFSIYRIFVVPIICRLY